MTSLSSPDIATYFSDNKDDGRSLWFFQHIPKTAGTSFRNEIAALLGDFDIGNVRANYDDQSIPLEEQLDAATEAFIAYNGANRLRFGSGHLYQRQIDRIVAALPPVRLITMLRNPVERLISEYRYSITPTHPPHQEFFAMYPTVEHYVEDVGYQNMMCAFLRRSPDETPAQIIDRLEHDYAFVGLVGLYPLSFRMITTLLGAPAWPKLRVNATSDTKENAIEIGPALRRRIEACNALDGEVYQHFLDLLHSRRGAILRHFEREQGCRLG